MSATTIDTVEMDRYLLEKLPMMLEESAEIQRAILRISQRRFADSNETNDRFERMFKELQQDRERSEKRWQANQDRFEAMQHELEEMRHESNERWQKNQHELEEMRRESNERWKENNERWQKNQHELEEMRRESNERWEENHARWEENRREMEAMRRQSDERWEENRREMEAMRRQSDERFEFLVNEVKALHRKHESSIGALGARWGIAAESSFRDGLKDLLEHDFGVQVLNVTEYDDDGEVFGRPDQVELDIIIQNGTLIICEIKSSMSRSDMYAFYRKVQFYEKRHQRSAAKLMVISPMVDHRAQTVAEQLGIVVHAYADEVQL